MLETKGKPTKLTDNGIKAWLDSKSEKSGNLKLTVPGEPVYLILRKAKPDSDTTPTWRMDYRMGDKAKTITLGKYPEMSLKEAKRAGGDASRMIEQGLDPVTARRLAVQSNILAGENTFKKISDAWLQKQKLDWSEVHFKKASRAFERDLYPRLGNLPITAISAPLIANVIESTLYGRGAIESADRVMQHLKTVFDFAAGLGVFESGNPVPGAVAICKRKRPPPKSHPAIVDLPELQQLMVKAKGANVHPTLNMLHRLVAFTATRVGTATQARWQDFDFETGVWTIPREFLKVKSRALPLRLPLHPTLCDELREWQKVGLSETLLFPSPQAKYEEKPASSEGLEKFYRVQLGLAGKHCPHGWRAAFSTNANETKIVSQDVIELALDHVSDDKVAAAYDRGERWSQRVLLFNWWSSQLLQSNV